MILLNTLRKLIEKAISKRLQIYFIILDLIHSNQLANIKQCSICYDMFKL